jgi:GTP-binding protein EngB required for normal cell division
LAVENNETRLVNEYEAIRRREYTVITDLLEVLPRINDLPKEAVGQARDAMFHADHPFLMVFVGPFSSGKSSLINALLGMRELLAVGPVPTTDRINILRWGEDPQRMDSGGGEVDNIFHPSPLLKKVSLVDTPGLESVFQRHEETTRKFLHRSDVVLLVMLATQTMTVSNLEYLQKLREYGKKVIIIINQADLLTPEEAETVRAYVLDQSLDRLGFKPIVWMVSSKQGLAAWRPDGTLDAELWRASGMNQIQDYIENQLDDLDRLRQKLQTPLQIIQSVTTSALGKVRTNQAILDQYQAINTNIEQQLAAHQREQDRAVREISAEVGAKFGEITMRGSEAIRETFQLTRAFGALGRGLGELTGIARLFRRGDKPAYVRQAFERHKVFEPVGQLPTIVDKLGPHIEGRDLQDLDDLVKYGQKEIRALPAAIREKVIGEVHAPVQYDRRMIQEVRPELEKLESEAQVLEVDKITATARNALLYLALWEVLVIIAGVALLASGVGQETGANIVLFLLILGLGMGGLLIVPLMGRVIETQYTNRLLNLQTRYIETMTRAAEKQIDYGMRLRRDAVAPLTRLIEAQTQIHNDQMGRLRLAEGEMAKIEAELNKLGKRGFLGIRG